MEVFFLNFQKFFPSRPNPAKRGGEQAEKSPNFVGNPQQYGQNQAAEGEKVPAAAQRHGSYVIDAHLPVVLQQGEGEEGRDHPQPEQQVEPEGQPAQLQGPAHRAHPVVGQPQQRPQQKALPRYRRLGDHVRGHGQRSSRARKPPRLPEPSSS